MKLFNKDIINKIVPMQNDGIVRVAVVIACAIFLQACVDSNMTDLREFVETAYQDEKPEIDPLPPFEPYKAFKYSPDESSDPFSVGNIITNRDQDGNVISKRPDADRDKENLERFPLDALSLVGTMTQKGVPWVVVETSEGTAHLATVGNYMGQNDGKIKDIFPDEERVVLVETVPDPSGRWVTRDVEITIDE